MRAIKFTKEQNMTALVIHYAVSAVEALVQAPVLVAPECDGHLVADRGVPQRCHPRGVAAVDPALKWEQRLSLDA